MTAKKELSLLKNKLKELVRVVPARTIKERVWGLECDISMMHEWMRELEEKLNELSSNNSLA